MLSSRQSKLVGLGVLGAAILALGFVGCGDDDSSEETTSTISADVQEAVCLLRQDIGDTDCDGTIDADADSDGIVDPIDRYPSGYDFGDDDSDGFANWADLEPLSPQYTVKVIETPEALERAAQGELEELEAEAARLAQGNAGVQVVLDQMEQEAERLESQDADSDGIADFYDPQPDLHSAGDQDNDGVTNDDDLFPLSEAYE